jgi:putative transposase
MHKAFKFRIYPIKEQEILINKTFGCCRFVFNHFLEKWNETYGQTGKGLTYNVCAKQLTQLKKKLDWLKEVDSTALQNALKHLDDAFKRFFKKLNGLPRFKSKKNPVQSYTSQCNYSKKGKPTIEVVGNKIKLPKLGWVTFAKSREVEGKILFATIRCNPTGKYFVSIVCETEIKPLPTSKKAVGVDLGLKDFAILSTGEKINAPKYYSPQGRRVELGPFLFGRRDYPRILCF